MQHGVIHGAKTMQRCSSEQFFVHYRAVSYKSRKYELAKAFHVLRLVGVPQWSRVDFATQPLVYISAAVPHVSARSQSVAELCSGHDLREHGQMQF